MYKCKFLGCFFPNVWFQKDKKCWRISLADICLLHVQYLAFFLFTQLGVFGCVLRVNCKQTEKRTSGSDDKKRICLVERRGKAGGRMYEKALHKSLQVLLDYNQPLLWALLCRNIATTVQIF